MTPQEFEVVQKKIEQAQREVSQAEGSLETIQNRLKKEFGCPDIKAAELKIAALEKSIANQTQQMDTMCTYLKGILDGWS